MFVNENRILRMWQTDLVVGAVRIELTTFGQKEPTARVRYSAY
jgi:hypothetical protein